MHVQLYDKGFCFTWRTPESLKSLTWHSEKRMHLPDIAPVPLFPSSSHFVHIFTSQPLVLAPRMWGWKPYRSCWALRIVRTQIAMKNPYNNFLHDSVSSVDPWLTGLVQGQRAFSSFHREKQLTEARVPRLTTTCPVSLHLSGFNVNTLPQGISR